MNPTSRRNRKHLDSIRQIAASCPRVHLCVTESSAEVSAGLAELATRPVDILAISGGDGTVSRVLTHLIDEAPFAKMPLIAILPGGTANMTAGDIGLRGSVRATLQRLVDWQRDQSRASQVVCRSVLRVQPGEGLTPHYGFFFGAGAVVQGIEYTNENIHSRGLKNELSLGLGLVRSMWGIARQDSRFVQATRIGIGIDNKMIAEATDITLLVVSTLERLFLNIHPFWGEANGKSLHATIVNSPAKRLIRNMPALLRGKPNRHLSPHSGYRSYNLETISLSFDGPFTMDGEIMHARIESGPVTVSNGGELSFLRL